ncbi:MAG: AAA family ATPase [Cyanobacteriota/Melainabacteria group bacterium]
MKNKWRIVFILAAILLIQIGVYLVIPDKDEMHQNSSSALYDAQQVQYSELKQVFAKKPESIYRITIIKNQAGIPSHAVIQNSDGNKIKAVLPSVDTELEIRNIADQYDIQYGAEVAFHEANQVDSNDSAGAGFFGLSISSVIMIAIFSAMLFIMWKQYQNGPGGANKLAKSKHKTFTPEKGVVKFSDVAGLDEVQEDVELLVEYLKNPQEIKNLGGKVAKATLLSGPPGTGKTLIAKAVAGEAGVPAFYINASEFVEMYVGVGAARVRDMFEEIRKKLPCILIIDELDAVAQHRGTGIGGGNDERHQTINQLLSEMDGFEDNDGLIIFGLTNRPDVLDPAIMRSGRFGDRKVTVGLPDRKARLEIIQVHARGLSLDPSVDPDLLAQATSGLSGADIAAILKVHGTHFAIKRTRAQKGKNIQAKSITFEDLENGISQIQMGSQATNNKSRRLSERVKKLLAYHELGHALIGEYLYRLNNDWSQYWHDPVQKVTIIGAGGAGGYTKFQGEEDPFCQTKEQLLGRVISALAANRAELKFLGTTSTGAQNDIQQAYQIAKEMVTKLGMSSLGSICAGKNSESPFLGKTMSNSGDYGLGPESSNQIDYEIKLILDFATHVADSILDKTENLIHTMAPVLMEEETFQRDRFLELWEKAELFVDPNIFYNSHAQFILPEKTDRNSDK